MRQCSGVHTIGSKHNRGNIRRSQSVSAPSPPNLTNHRHIISTAIPQQCDLFMIASNSSFNNWSLNHFNFSDDSTTMSSCMISRLLSTGAVFACISLLNWHYETPSRDQTSLISYLTPGLIHQWWDVPNNIRSWLRGQFLMSSISVQRTITDCKRWKVPTFGGELRFSGQDSVDEEDEGEDSVERVSDDHVVWLHDHKATHGNIVYQGCCSWTWLIMVYIISIFTESLLFQQQSSLKTIITISSGFIPSLESFFFSPLSLCMFCYSSFLFVPLDQQTACVWFYCPL